MLADDVIQRLKERVADLRTVEGVADLARLQGQNLPVKTSPAAFVIASGLQGGAADAATGLFRQVFEEVISVFIVFRNTGDTGARALDLVDTVKWAVIEALCGWAPDDTLGVFSLRNGRASTPSPGTIAFQIDFAIGDQLRIYPS